VRGGRSDEFPSSSCCGLRLRAAVQPDGAQGPNGPNPLGPSLSDDEIIREAREAFELAADAEAENRREALDDLRFARLGEQWPEQVRRERELGASFLRSAPAAAGAHQAAGGRLWPGAAGMTSRLTMMFAGVATVLAILAGLYWKGRHDGEAHERPVAEAAQAQAAVAGLEARGAQQSARQAAAAVARRDAAAAAVMKLSNEALRSEAAHAPLDPARAARLLANDRELCRAAPELAGCPAP
jgi:hypothetical protein